MTIARTAAHDLVLAFVAQTSRFLARLIFGAFVLVWISAASMADETPTTDREIMSIVIGETVLSFPKTQNGFSVLVRYDLAGVPNSDRSFPFTIPQPEADTLAKMVSDYYSKLTASLATGNSIHNAYFRLYPEGLFPDPENGSQRLNLPLKRALTMRSGKPELPNGWPKSFYQRNRTNSAWSPFLSAKRRTGD
jgi:hypothetical protein